MLEWTYRAIQKGFLPDISLAVIYKWLKWFGFVTQKPIEKSYLNAKHRYLHLQFAKESLETPVFFGDL